MNQWTPEKEAKARELYLDGWFYGDIAKALGTTKNAVAGKMHRLNVPIRGFVRRDRIAERTRRLDSEPPGFAVRVYEVPAKATRNMTRALMGDPAPGRTPWASLDGGDTARG